MATEILRPNGAGDETGILNQSPSSTYHWDKVDEASPDDDTTFVAVHSTQDGRDLYNLSNLPRDGIINWIKVWVRCCLVIGSCSAKIALKTGGTVYETSITLTGSYADFGIQYTANPQTGVAWTSAQLDVLQVGVHMVAGAFESAGRCTQVYVDVDYEPHIFESYTTGNNWAGGIYDDHWYSQTFTPSVAHSITGVTLLLYRTGSPANLEISLKEVDVEGKPTGNDLAYALVNANGLTTSENGEWKEIYFDTLYELAVGTKYGIVARATGGTSSNWVGWCANTGGGYSGGNMCWSTNSGSSWTTSTYDMLFEDWGFLITSPAPYLAINVASVDSDNNGVLNNTDEWAMIAAKTNYVRRFDSDFDGDVDADDDFRFDGARALVPNLGVIRKNIRTDTCQRLDWSNFTCYLIQCVDTAATMQRFTGEDTSPYYGWIHVHWHPAIPAGAEYVCYHYALDTVEAAYKALGYGILMHASSSTHSYNMFWIGGDWTDLNNWRILEPQTGAIFNAVGVAEAYQTNYIYFHKYTDSAKLYYNSLSVDYANEVISYGGTDHGVTFVGDTYEEPPDINYTFDVTLGNRFVKYLTGAVTSTSTLNRSTSISLSGAVTSTSTLNRSTSISLSGVTTITGSINNLIKISLIGIVSFASSGNIPELFLRGVGTFSGAGASETIYLPKWIIEQKPEAQAEILGASKPELAVYRALLRLGESFEFQSKMMGGRDVKGGSVTDFLLRQYSLIISVIGWYYHNRPESKARDNLQRLALSSQGYTVIYIDEQDALDNAEYFCKEAIRGVDHSRYKYLV